MQTEKMHHRQTIRLKGYDYSKAGLYFITICTHNRACLFGEISDEKMVMNEIGKIANQCWLQIPEHFPNVILHDHIIMPNHVHGIIELKKVVDVGAENFLPLRNNMNNIAGVENFQPPPSTPRQQNEFQKMIPRSIGSIVKGFKIGVTKWVRNHTDRIDVWQRNYHDHIIRNQQSYETIADYIISNPAKWKEDKFFINHDTA
ncbi:MAG: transposase [Bacteroidia bacterium]